MAVAGGHVESVGASDWQPLSFPALRIDHPGGLDQLWIRIITLKRSTALTSELFEILDNETLDVFHYDTSSTKEKILHSIQVKVLKPSELDIDDLKCKLHSWAAQPAE